MNRGRVSAFVWFVCVALSHLHAEDRPALAPGYYFASAPAQGNPKYFRASFILQTNGVIPLGEGNTNNVTRGTTFFWAIQPNYGDIVSPLYPLTRATLTPTGRLRLRYGNRMIYHGRVENKFTVRGRFYLLHQRRTYYEQTFWFSNIGDP